MEWCIVKLVELNSDYPTFKPIRFNKNGFSFIAGREKNKNETSTYNGVGKTLSIVLIDFCLGATPLEDLKKLKCNIILTVNINNQNFVFKRHTVNNKVIFIDDKEYSSDKFKKKLEEMLSIERQDNISLRTVMSYFIRYKKSSFLDPVVTNKYNNSRKADYASLVNVFYLLGLDTTLLKEKQQNYKKLEIAKNAKKSLEDKEIKSLLNNNNTNIDIELNILEKKLEEKNRLRELYKISNSYTDLKSELFKEREELNEITNKIEVLKSNINKINASLEEKHDITVDELKSFYKDIFEIFPKNVVRELYEVEKFHNNLMENRMNRLSNSKIELTAELETDESIREQLQSKIDEIYLILGNNGELLEYDTLNNEIDKISNQITKYNSYKDNISLIDKRILECSQNISNNNLMANQYLIDNRLKIDELNKTFASLVVDLYGDDTSGSISIKNNTATNSIQFEFETKIKNDSSTGIGNSKILCFSTMLLFKNNINIDFMVMDNKVLEGIASNQLANYFKTIYGTDNFQYIFAINQNEMNELKVKLGNDYKNIIEDNIVLDLNDDGDEGKLLGVTIEMDLQEK